MHNNVVMHNHVLVPVSSQTHSNLDPPFSSHLFPTSSRPTFAPSLISQHNPLADPPAWMVSRWLSYPSSLLSDVMQHVPRARSRAHRLRRCPRPLLPALQPPLTPRSANGRGGCSRGGQVQLPLRRSERRPPD